MHYGKYLSEMRKRVFLRIFSASGELRPMTPLPTRGFAPGPHGGYSPSPDYRLALHAHHRPPSGHQNGPNSFCAADPPRTLLGELTTLAQTESDEEGTPLPIPVLPRRLLLPPTFVPARLQGLCRTVSEINGYAPRPRL